MTQAELRELWKSRVDAYKSSGQSTAEWCEAHQINRSQLWYWLRKFKGTTQRQAPSPPWVSVEVETTPSKADSVLQVKVGVASIEVKRDFDRALLSDVVQTLQKLC